MPEFSHIIHLRDLEDEPVTLTLDANDESRRALAERFGLLDITRLVASVKAEKTGKRGIRLSGSIDAEVVQSCVTSLKPVDANVKEDFSVRFVPSDEIEAGSEEEDAWIDAEGTEDVEPLVGEKVDVGEVVAQSLSLSLDPYPRAEGAELSSGERSNPTEEPEADRANPFAVLKKLTK